MRKLMFAAALGAAALTAERTLAMNWEVLCVKQGPLRGCNLPLRELDPDELNPPNTPGYPIKARSIPSKAEVAEKSDAPGAMNFFSLGFGGQIILRSSAWFTNGDGPDITLYETTWGNPSCKKNISESALVEVSQDGLNWITPGPVEMGPQGPWNSCHNGSFDITPLFYAQYLRITDRTNPHRCLRGDGNDAFDVDGLVANYEPSSLEQIPGLFSVACDYQQGVASQFVGQPDNFPGRGIVAQRKNFANANINEPGFPAEAFTNPSVRDAVSGVYNFWSLGFGGYACFRLPYTVFNGPGPDIYAFETTWQNKPCPNYPEKADVQVSADGINWSPALRICKDALGIMGSDPAINLDSFPGYPIINYIRFTDATNPADFGSGADSYDIDNIFLAQLPPTDPNIPNPYFSCWGDSSGNNARRAAPSGSSHFIDGGIPEEMFALEIVGGSMIQDRISFKATIAEEGGYHYSIRSASGQEVISGELEGNLYETAYAEVPVNTLNKGVYFLTLSSAGSRETVKFVKQ